MKKTVLVLVSVLALLLGACGQIPFFTPTPGSGPTVDAAATSDALFKTAVAQTLTARPSLPGESTTETPTSSPSETATPAASPVLASTETATLPPSPAASMETATLPAGVAASPTGQTGTATNVIFTATLGAGQATASPTLGIRTYGTLPPAVPFSQVTLINKANAEAYISLQVTMPDGKYSIIEYPVEGRVKIEAPVGSYLYVAWVGGRKLVGEFRLHNNDDISITLYRDRVIIK